MMMRVLAVAIFVALLQLATCKSVFTSDRDLPSNWLTDRSTLIKRTNKYISDLINTEEDLKKVRQLLDYVDTMRDGLTDLEAHAHAQRMRAVAANSATKRAGGNMYKKDAFWQAMGGPLPVETRLASFGSRIIPDRSGPSPMVKPMRYGKRSGQ